MNRRSFIQMTAGAALASTARPLTARARQTGPVGANDRLRMAIIGSGNRGNQVMDSFAEAKHANVFVASQIAYVRDFDIEIAQDAAIADPVVGTFQDGIALDVRPTISADRKYITLEMRPTVGTPRTILAASPSAWKPLIATEPCPTA